MNKLREFLTWEDLVRNAEQVQIVRWVNELAEKKERQAVAHRRYNQTQKALVRVAREMLDRGELDALVKEAKG